MLYGYIVQVLSPSLILKINGHGATWCSGPMRGWLYNWARDRGATTLGLSETHAINGHCTIYPILYIDGRCELN
jgi:hypothetical protein